MKKWHTIKRNLKSSLNLAKMVNEPGKFTQEEIISNKK